MFGHRDEDDKKADEDNQDVPAEANEEVINAGADEDDSETTEDAPETAEPSSIVTPDPDSDNDAADGSPAPDEDADADPVSAPPVDSEADEAVASDEEKKTEAQEEKPWQHPGEPLDEGPEPISDVISPAGGFPKRPSFKPGEPSLSFLPPSSADDNDETAHELIDIKQTALTELAPFVDELDLSPEDKFRTIMMIIQASDDQTMVKKAYEAAHSIEDEKIRAQALLDIVNEITYFTQPHEDVPQP